MATKLDLEETENGYLLSQTEEDGTRTEIILSAGSILQLAQSALRLRDAVLARQLPSTIAPSKVISRVRQIGLNRDAIYPEVHLEVYLEDDIQQTFSIPVNIARSLSDALPKYIIEAEKSQQNTQH